MRTVDSYPLPHSAIALTHNDTITYPETNSSIDGAGNKEFTIPGKAIISDWTMLLNNIGFSTADSKAATGHISWLPWKESAATPLRATPSAPLQQ